MSAAPKFTYELIDAPLSRLGEGPVWDQQTKTIYWVDILNGNIHAFATVTGQHRTLPVGDMIGALALCTNGEFIAALKSGLAFINRETGEVKHLHHPELHLPENRFNDGKCDPAGRLWVGTMALAETTGAGSLYMIEKDLRHTVKIKGVSISNGMAWTNDKKTFYYIDTPTLEVVAYDYDVDTGAIQNKRAVINFPAGQGFPDGMTIDNEGMLWIAHWDGWQVSRWDPHSGKQLLRISLPASRITCCTFGGGNLQDLYISSANVGLADRIEEPLAGALFVIKNSGFEGVEATAFDYQQSGG